MCRYKEEPFKRSMKLVLDFNRMMADSMGEQGIDEQALAGSMMAIFDAEEAFTEKRAQLGLVPEAALLETVCRKAADLAAAYEAVVFAGPLQEGLKALAHPYHNELPEARPRLYHMEHVDPEALKQLLDVVDPKNTLFLVPDSKSTTLSYLKKALEPLSGQAEILPEAQTGLLYAALAGADLKELAAGAAYMEDICQEEDTFRNPGYMWGILESLAEDKGYATSYSLNMTEKALNITSGPLQMKVLLPQVNPFTIGELLTLEKTAAAFKQLMRPEQAFAWEENTEKRIEPEARFII